MKNFLTKIGVLFVIVLMFCFNANAYSKGYRYSFDLGGVDGSFNNVYYTLNRGTVYLTDNVCYMGDHPSSGGEMSVDLFRERIGFDYCYGTRLLGTVTSVSSINPTHLDDVSFTVDQQSSKYYLCFHSQSGPLFIGSGIVSQ